MRNVLIAWVGATDLRAPTSEADGVGPIANALDAREYDGVYLLCDYPAAKVDPYLKWLGTRSKSPLHLVKAKLTSPTNFREIYAAAVGCCERVLADGAAGETRLTFHLSPGTPAMAAVWIILGKGRFQATLIQSSKERGVQDADVPFDLYADFVPDLLRERDQQLRDATAAEPPAAPEFADIVHRGAAMKRLIQRARRVAAHNVPVLIEGESGTGKELLARAIHNASPRRGKEMVPINCGAIPSELVESQLFGHEKGAFTGAAGTHQGVFERAHGGTLFLDEVGELPLPAQVKLLRVLQEGEVWRLGGTKAIKVDVRIVAATHRVLVQEIAANRFREDLFYRLAVAVLKVPPVRDRSEDRGPLLEFALAQANRQGAGDPAYQAKKLSAGARKVLLEHPWPGNVRELVNTLHRAAIWTEGHTISADDAREALLPATSAPVQDILGRPLGGSFDLNALLADVSRHYLTRAMQETHGNKSKATELLGFNNYQTLTKWLDRYEIKA